MMSALSIFFRGYKLFPIALPAIPNMSPRIADINQMIKMYLKAFMD